MRSNKKTHAKPEKQARLSEQSRSQNERLYVTPALGRVLERAHSEMAHQTERNTSLIATTGAFLSQAIVQDDYGEPCRIRTCDPLIKSQLLYQLS